MAEQINFKDGDNQAERRASFKSSALPGILQMIRNWF